MDGKTGSQKVNRGDEPNIKTFQFHLNQSYLIWRSKLITSNNIFRLLVFKSKSETFLNLQNVMTWHVHKKL